MWIDLTFLNVKLYMAAAKNIKFNVSSQDLTLFEL